MEQLLIVTGVNNPTVAMNAAIPVGTYAVYNDNNEVIDITAPDAIPKFFHFGVGTVDGNKFQQFISPIHMTVTSGDPQVEVPAVYQIAVPTLTITEGLVIGFTVARKGSIINGGRSNWSVTTEARTGDTQATLLARLVAVANAQQWKPYGTVTITGNNISVPARAGYDINVVATDGLRGATVTNPTPYAPEGWTAKYVQDLYDRCIGNDGILATHPKTDTDAFYPIMRTTAAQIAAVAEWYGVTLTYDYNPYKHRNTQGPPSSQVLHIAFSTEAARDAFLEFANTMAQGYIEQEAAAGGGGTP